MSEPKTVGELKMAVDALKESTASELRNFKEATVSELRTFRTELSGFKETIIAQFKSVDNEFANLKKLVWAIVGFVVIGLGGAWGLHQRLSGVEVKLAEQVGALGTAIEKQAREIKTDFATTSGETKQQLALTNQRLDQTQAALTRIEGILQPQPKTPGAPPFAPITLDKEDRELILKVVSAKIGLPKPVPGAKTSVTEGDPVPAGVKLISVPEELVASLKKLKDSKLTFDEKSGAIIIVAAGETRVGAVIELAAARSITR